MKTFKNVCEPPTFESIKCYFTGISLINYRFRSPQEKPGSRKTVIKKRKEDLQVEGGER